MPEAPKPGDIVACEECPFCHSELATLEESGHLQTQHETGCDFKPCGMCGSSRVHRHASNPRFFVATHRSGCVMGRITVIEINSEKHRKWQTRPNER